MFSVVILSKNVVNLTACCYAIREHEPGLGRRVIVVDDGIPEDWFDSEATEVLSGEKPFIFARNANIGLRHAFEVQGADGVVLLNDDALLQSPSGFSTLEQAAKEHPEYGIIGVTTNVTGQRMQFRLPRPIGLRTVPHIAFVGVYIPRRTVEKVGYLDERYCLDYGVEDRDYCEAVARAGLKIGVHDHCYVDHGSLVSSFRGDPKTPASFQKNQALFNEKWGVRW
jgi:GT2 family glycosyltransferase